MPPASLLDELAVVTVTVPMGRIDSAADLYTSDLGWTRRWSGRAGILGEAWGIGPDRMVTYLAPHTETRGWVRMVEGPTPAPPPLSTWGWNAMEICVADVEEMLEAVSSSPHFRVNGLPKDLAVSDDPPGQRAMQAVGPYGIQVFLTQVLYQIPGLELLTPPSGARVGGVFIAVLAAESYEQSKEFYRDGLGMAPAVEFEYRPTAARERNWPEGDQIRIGAFKTNGVTLIEIGGYGNRARRRPVRAGELPPAIGMASFAAADIDAAVSGLTGAGGRVVGDRTAVAHPPYEGREAVLAQAPGGELIELIG